MGSLETVIECGFQVVSDTSGCLFLQQLQYQACPDVTCQRSRCILFVEEQINTDSVQCLATLIVEGVDDNGARREICISERQPHPCCANRLTSTCSSLTQLQHL